MGEGSAVAARLRQDSDGAGFLDPLSRGQGKAVQAGALSKPVEFDGIKAGIVETLPDAEKLDCGLLNILTSMQATLVVKNGIQRS